MKLKTGVYKHNSNGEKVTVTDITGTMMTRQTGRVIPQVKILKQDHTTEFVATLYIRKFFTQIL